MLKEVYCYFAFVKTNSKLYKNQKQNKCFAIYLINIQPLT